MKDEVIYDEQHDDLRVQLETDGNWNRPPLENISLQEHQAREGRAAKRSHEDHYAFFAGIGVGVLAGLFSQSVAVGLIVAIVAMLAIAKGMEHVR